MCKEEWNTGGQTRQKYSHMHEHTYNGKNIKTTESEILECSETQRERERETIYFYAVEVRLGEVKEKSSLV